MEDSTMFEVGGKQIIAKLGGLLFLLILASSFSLDVTGLYDIPQHEPTELEMQHINAQNLNNVTDLELFIDNLISQQMSTYHIRGAHISIVKEEQIYYSNGYGFYHNESGSQPVSANSTLFMVASLSKAVTATAIMQLVEDGLLDLDANINDYLEAFQVPETFTDPITITHLLSHTSGLENTLAPVYVNTAEELPTLEEILITELPNRITPPGIAAMYSNFGYALLGYIMEVVSETTFQDYVRREIFNPLGMNNSYFEQELVESGQEYRSPGYSYDLEEGYIERPIEFSTIPPAAGLITTAEDYGRFLIAHLNNGTLQGNRILENDTIQMMHDVYFEARPDMDGVCFGFYERDMNGLDGLGHGGITNRFRSTSFLLTEENVGIYVCYNTDTADAAGAELIEAFMDRYYPMSETITPLAGYEERVNRYVGEYINSHYYFLTAQKIELLSTRSFEYMKVTANSDGTINVQRVGSLSASVSFDTDFVEVEPGFFLDASGESKLMIAFLENENGVITHLYFSGFPPESWILRPSIEFSLLSLIFIQINAFGALLFLPLFLIMELRFFLKKRKNERNHIRAISLLGLVGIAVSLVQLLSMFIFSIPTMGRILLFISTIVIAFLLALTVIYSRSRYSLIDNHGTLIRFVASSHYSISIPVFTLISDGFYEWKYLTTLTGIPATWTQIMSSYHSTMNLIFILLATYLVAVVVLGLLVGFSWTQKGGFNRTSRRSILERVLYTLYFTLSLIVVWILNLWNFFAFIV